MKTSNWLPQKMRLNSLDKLDTNIRIIGDRKAGKTVYMASLAYWPNANKNSPVKSVTSIGQKSAGKELLKYAQDILEQGLQLKATPLNPDIKEVKDYGLSIELKEQFRWYNLINRNLRLTISCKDYGGEFFSDLLKKSHNQLLQDYLNDCIRATGILLLVDGTAYSKDEEYAFSLEQFLNTLSQPHPEEKGRRIAFALTKCELVQLWVRRHDPRGLTQSLFPNMKKKLETWQTQNLGVVDYFTVSSFGTLGKDNSEPNTKIIKPNREGTTSVIKDTRKWRPFGLVSPIYWLSTGQRHKALDED
ncbi:MAG: hypothetical protein QNJ64_20795 [Crocosphaera sp.]|nr:hypothetical protein [Crocosphaera sp.]